MIKEPSNSDSPPGSRIQIINASLRCFVYSLMGLVPLIGLPFSVAAIVQSQKVHKAADAGWNPAGRYLTAAHRIGPLGFLTSAGFLVVVCVILPALGSEMSGGSSGSG